MHTMAVHCIASATKHTDPHNRHSIPGGPTSQGGGDTVKVERELL